MTKREKNTVVQNNNMFGHTEENIVRLFMSEPLIGCLTCNMCCDWLFAAESPMFPDMEFSYHDEDEERGDF